MLTSCVPQMILYALKSTGKNGLCTSYFIAKVHKKNGTSNSLAFTKVKVCFIDILNFILPPHESFRRNFSDIMKYTIVFSLLMFEMVALNKANSRTRENQPKMNRNRQFSS